MPLLFAYGINRFSHDAPHLGLVKFFPNQDSDLFPSDLKFGARLDLIDMVNYHLLLFSEQPSSCKQGDGFSMNFRFLSYN